jgi:hypothetical protein
VGPDWCGDDGSLWYTSYVGVAADGYPAVSFADNSNDSAWWSLWHPGAGWSAPAKLPYEYIPARILTDANGIVTAVDGHNKLHRSFDNGQSWQSYHVETLGIHSTNFDYAYLLNTGDFRFQTYSTTTGKVKVWTVGFTGKTTPGAEKSEVSQKISASREKVE